MKKEFIKKIYWRQRDIRHNIDKENYKKVVEKTIFKLYSMNLL